MKKKLGVLAMVFVMVAGTVSTAFAEDEAKAGYLALGSDLGGSQLEVVLDLLKVDDVANYDVTYITNAEEHAYLDSYVSSSAIGTQALSSVLLQENSGDKIDVKTYNINYCTEDMYRNALATAGVKGADVVVAGPYEISGTAALVGTIKLYENMTGETVDDEVIEGAVDELTTTGSLADTLGDTDAAENIMAEIKEQLADNPDMSDSELEQLIRDAAEKVGKTLSDADVAKIKNMLQKLQGLDIDWDNVKSQSSDVLNSVKGFLSGIDFSQFGAFFSDITSWVKNLF